MDQGPAMDKGFFTRILIKPKLLPHRPTDHCRVEVDQGERQAHPDGRCVQLARLLSVLRAGTE